MTTPTTPDRLMATVFGGGILAAIATAVVIKTGGFFTAQAAITFASFGGVFAAAFVLGRGTAAKHIAIPLMIAIGVGEITNLGLTAERQIAAREDLQAPLKAQALEHTKAAARLDEMRKAEPSSPRLTLAKAALAEAKAGLETQAVKIAREIADKAQADVDKEAANVACKRECKRKQDVANAAKADLAAALAAGAKAQESRIASAQAEVTASLTEAVAAHKQAITEAEASFKARRAPPSATPLADRTGIPQWVLDLAFAGGGALAAVVLAACLVAHGASPVPGKPMVTGFAFAANDSGNRIPGILTPPRAPEPPNGGRRGRKADAEIVDFSERFRVQYGRAPTGSEIRAQFPALPTSTAYDYAGRARRSA